MNRRAVLAAACASPLVFGIAGPAQAAGSCSIVVPAKVTITKPWRTVTVKAGKDCAASGMESAYWSVIDPRKGPFQMFLLSSEQPSETVDWYDWDPLGTFKVRAEGAHDSEYEDIAQRDSTMTVRLGSRITAKSSRKGQTVTITANTKRYSPSYETYRTWAKSKVTLRTKTCSNCAWRNVKTATADSKGNVRFVVRSKAKYWQVVSKDTGNTWGRASSTIKR